MRKFVGIRKSSSDLLTTTLKTCGALSSKYNLKRDDLLLDNAPVLKWKSVRRIEIGLELAPFVVFVYFFSSFEDVKSLLILGPNNTKNSSLKCEFLIFSYE